MASLISQMRNGTPQQFPVQQNQQQQLDKSLEQTRAIMQQFEHASDRQAALMSLIQNNPQLGWLPSLLKNGNSLEGIAKQMAQMNQLDINYILKSLQSNM